MGRSTGLQGSFFSDARVLGPLTLYPQHRNQAGGLVSARAEIPVRINSRKGTNQANGEKGRKDDYKLVAWGKLAYTMAKSCPPGKALDVICRPQSYKGKLFNPDGSLRMDGQGQVIEITKYGFVILEIGFGEDSDKWIANEIANGFRPPQWNVQGTGDWDWWKGELKRRQSIEWDGRSNVFGYAKIRIPQGVTLDFSQPVRQQQGQYQGNVNQNINGAGFNQSPEQAVRQAFNGNVDPNQFRPNFGGGNAGGGFNNGGGNQNFRPNFGGGNPNPAGNGGGFQPNFGGGQPQQQFNNTGGGDQGNGYAF